VLGPAKDKTSWERGRNRPRLPKQTPGGKKKNNWEAKWGNVKQGSAEGRKGMGVLVNNFIWGKVCVKKKRKYRKSRGREE